MSGLISRLNSRVPTVETEPRVLEVGREDTDAVLDALSSGTSRALYGALHDDPATPSEVAERVDTSLQNVHYHLEKLQGAGLVVPVDTVYSDRGNEMTVYGPASDPIVLVGETDDDLDVDLAEIAGGVGALALVSLVVQFAVEALVASPGTVADVLGPASADPAAGEGGSLVARVVLDVVEPGVLFFLGGLLVAVAAGLWLRRR